MTSKFLNDARDKSIVSDMSIISLYAQYNI